ncbi:MAG TPA: hypothetical protein PK002_10935 [Cellvibrio sp.]|nr:hypothetical protein [Cellvibrio sp.]
MNFFSMGSDSIDLCEGVEVQISQFKSMESDPIDAIEKDLSL